MPNKWGFFVVALQGALQKTPAFGRSAGAAGLVPFIRAARPHLIAYRSRPGTGASVLS